RGYTGRVAGGDAGGEDARAGGGAHTRGLELILHREGHAVKGAERRAGREDPRRRAGVSPRLVAAYRDVAAQIAVESIDAFEVALEQRYRGNVAGADQRRLLDGGSEHEVVGRR